MREAIITLFGIAALSGLTVSGIVVRLAARWTRDAGLAAFWKLLLSLAGLSLAGLVPGEWRVGGFRLQGLVYLAAGAGYLAALPRFVGAMVGARLKPWAARLYALAAAADLALWFLVNAGWEGMRLGAELLVFGCSIGFAARLAVGLARVEDPLVQRLFRRFCVASVPLMAFSLLVAVGAALGWPGWEAVRPLPNAVYFLVVSLLIVAESSRWLMNSARRSGAGEEPAEADPGGAGTAPEADKPDRTLVELGLSVRQRQIARLVLQGDSAKEIAGKLGISPKTAENHIYSIFQRAGARSRIQFYHLVNGPQS